MSFYPFIQTLSRVSLQLVSESACHPDTNPALHPITPSGIDSAASQTSDIQSHCHSNHQQIHHPGHLADFLPVAYTSLNFVSRTASHSVIHTASQISSHSVSYTGSRLPSHISSHSVIHIASHISIQPLRQLYRKPYTQPLRQPYSQPHIQPLRQLYRQPNTQPLRQPYSQPHIQPLCHSHSKLSRSVRQSVALHK